MTQVGTYKVGPASSVVHNVQVSGDLLFVSYYKEGLRVCSIADPVNPVEIAHYDTYAPTADGCSADPTPVAGVCIRGADSKCSCPTWTTAPT